MQGTHASSAQQWVIEWKKQDFFFLNKIFYCPQILRFNPVWNENLKFPLYCPELAVLRMCVKDFDSTSADEFIGEFSVPVNSIRPGLIFQKIIF